MHTDSDCAEIASSWIDTFGRALAASDAACAATCIQPNGFLRDVLVFTWRNRTVRGTAEITAYVGSALARGDISLAQFRLDDRAGFAPVVGPNISTSSPRAVSAGFVFVTAIGTGRGYFTLVPAHGSANSDSDGGTVWKAVAVFMTLWEITGHEELGPEEGTYGGHTVAWEDVDAERREAVERDPLGGGQTALNVAARFRQMRIPTLVIEQYPRVGDSWRRRYPTLTLHTPKAHHSMLYHSYPDTWPIYTSRDKLANWLEQYAISQDLCVWTNSRALPTPTYDHVARRWTVTVLRNGTNEITLRPVHIVLAAGSIGAPRMPIPPCAAAAFAGTILHSTAYRGGRAFAGQDVVVVGAANSAADICQDLVVQGARTVTMVQRSSTCVVSCESIRRVAERIWPKDVRIEVADFKWMATPFRLLKEVLSEKKDELRAHEKDLHEKLTSAGMELNMGKDGSGQFPMFFERYGGLDVGCADLIGSGQVKIKHGVEVAKLTEGSVIFTDGSSLPAQAIVFATGYESIRDTMRELFGDAVIDQTGPVWGVDGEGEIRGCYHTSGHPGLWFTGGNFVTSRFYSKQLALQIKAAELGLV
ncbi:FAD/NAD-P-binding domain-containing protein, partial [Mycena pura]